jgi:tetratricopeptide (TPR) repeat protein
LARCKACRLPPQSARSSPRKAIGTSYCEAGRWQEALPVLGQAAEFFAQAGQAKPQADCHTNAARAALLSQDYAMAERYATLAAEGHRRAGAASGLAFDLVIQGELAIHKKDVAGAVARFREAVDQQVEAGSFQGVCAVVAMPALEALERAGAHQEVNSFSEYTSLAWIPMKGIDLKICPAGWGGRKP